MIDEYLESKVTTATPIQLHLMVIDGAIRHARAAHTAMQHGKMAEASTALSEARRFVGEMLAGLDEKQFAEVVGRLKAIFLFVLRNLVNADLERNQTLVAESISILQLHRETSLALAERLKQESAALVTSGTEGRFSWSS
jgi:flagellar protein FliS